MSGMATKQDKISFTKDAFSKNASKLPEFENHKKPCFCEVKLQN